MMIVIVMMRWIDVIRIFFVNIIIAHPTAQRPDDDEDDDGVDNQ